MVGSWKAPQAWGQNTQAEAARARLGRQGILRAKARAALCCLLWGGVSELTSPPALHTGDDSIVLGIDYVATILTGWQRYFLNHKSEMFKLGETLDMYLFDLVRKIFPFFKKKSFHFYSVYKFQV